MVNTQTKYKQEVKYAGSNSQGKNANGNSCLRKFLASLVIEEGQFPHSDASDAPPDPWLASKEWETPLGGSTSHSLQACVTLPGCRAGSTSRLLARQRAGRWLPQPQRDALYQLGLTTT